MVALIGGAMAKTASNSFAEVSGEGVESDGEMGFVIKNVAGDVVITISERDGWKSEKESPYTYTHKEGDTDNFYFAGREGEESVTVPISNIWECAHNTTNSFPHSVDPGFKVTTNEHAILMYAYPEKGCEIIPGADFEPVKGSHVLKVFEVPCPNPKCDFGKRDNPISEEIVEVEPSLKVETFVNDPDKKGIKVGDKTLYPYGTYTGGFSVTNDNKKCSDCCADARGKTTFDVCEARLSAAEYIGLDRTDAGYACEQFMTANVYLENAVGKPGFAWTTGANCMISGDSDKSDAKIAVKRKSENVPGGKGFEHSKSYRQEKLSCNASLSDGHGSSCEANVTLEGSYTVVKVDVQIEGTTELQEEERGAYTYYVPDGDSPLWQEEWTNSLKKVTITCEPSDGAMAAQTVDIKFTEHQLWVKAEDGTYEEAKNSYTVNELNKTTFYLHGHEKSEKYKGEKIVATHNNSGATDQAFYTVFGRPWLVPDYDRKNGIDPKDIATAKEGKKIFRFWINNDDDTRSEDGILFFDGLGHINDMTFNKPEGGPNQKSDKVSGYCDLEDFTPILLDISEVFPDGTPFELEKKVKWTMNSSCAGVVWTKLDASSAGDFLTAAYSNFGEDLDEHSYKADILRLADAKRPVEIPAKPLRHIVENGNKGVFLLEGLAEGDDIEIGVDIDNGKDSERITHGKLLMKIDYVEAMYRWMDLRAHLGKEPASPVHSNGLGEPLNGPDDNCNGFSRGSRHWVFAHGFNVNVDEARGWASTVFKRLWQSGDNSRYTFANWAGDEGQFSMPVEGLVSLDYYKDSENAFKTAGEFARQCGKLSGDIHLMAHSLGNILVSEAIQQYDLPYSRYYMLNAAVALQAYDPSAHIDDLMKDEAWDGLSKKEYTASYWHTLFPGEDFRSTLHWTNRYWKVHDNYNVYSATDHRLKNLEVNERGHLIDYSVWVLQEKAKGTVLVDCINVIDTLNWKVDAVDLAREGGWGMNVSAYPDCFVRMGVGYGVLSKAGALPRDAVVTNPLFLPFKNRPKALHSLELYRRDDNSEDQYRLLGSLLSDAIPATTFAAGANELVTAKENKDLWSCRDTEGDKKWPRKDKWFHSDIKNVSYYHISKFYEYLRKGNEK